MKPHGKAYGVIIRLMLDRKWRSREHIEEVVIKSFVDAGPPVPLFAQWRSATTKCIRWMVNSDWLEYKYKGEVQLFRILKPKMKSYLKAKAAYEVLKSKGFVRPDGVVDLGGTPPAPKTEKIKEAIRLRTGTYRGQ